MRIAVVASQGAFTSGLAGMLDVFSTANDLREQVATDVPTLTTSVLAPRATVRTASGMAFRRTGPLSEIEDAELVVVVGAAVTDGADLAAAMQEPQCRQVVSALEGLGASTSYAAACTGTFVLAEAGLLDGHRATTSWWLAPSFRRRHPSVRLDMKSMIVNDRRATTGGAAFAHVDLALAIVGRASPQLAGEVARFLLIDDRASQASYAALAHLRHSDALVVDFERYVRANLDRPLNVADIAKHIGTSRRTLERRCSDALGVSPLAVIRSLRVERAQHLRLLGHRPDEIASRVGYSDASTLRTLLRQSRGR